MAVNWRPFFAASLVAAGFIFKGVPILPVLAGIGAVALWNLYRSRKSAK